ncbi:MAG: SUMF1/EgtB/PvdO family nonheme iron enzyme [Deltaproteobacteria bacterium]|nr:SUMF1/EgtB/PvdO family nonheme iron enzyme [Deltaproteobacteria bacterium]
MKPLCFLLMFVTICCSSCQRSSGIKDDEDTSDTNTSSESTAPETSDDSGTADSNSSIGTGVDTETTFETLSDTVSEDTGTDTTPLPYPVENEWIYIEGGSFEMGSELFEYSQPVHTVTVPSFEILKTEVTTHQFRQCVEAGGCIEPDASSSNCFYTLGNWAAPERFNHPINCITHSLASSYCDWLGGRLPSEAEWEYAARGGGQDISYPWGNEAPTCDLAVMMRTEEFPCYSEDSLPVCSVPDGNTSHGLCDMAGNFMEWVADRVSLKSDYSGAPLDGSAHEMEGAEYAVIRGGSSDSSPTGIHVSNRWFDRSTYPTNRTFRCARDTSK